MALALLAPASVASAARPPLAAYTTAEGLAGNRVLRIVRDSRGFLWFCTDNGLSRFDGRRFATIAAEGELVKDLRETRDGSYWVATAGAGVLRFEPDRPAPDGRAQATTVKVGNGHFTNDVSRLYEDRAGRLWAGTMGGLFSLAAGHDGTGGRFERVPLGIAGHPDTTVHVWSFAEDDHGCLWIGHAFGLSRLLPAGRMAHYAIEPVAGADYVWDLAWDPRGVLWVSQEKWLYALRPDEPRGATDGRRRPWTKLMAPRTSAPAGSLPASLPSVPGEAIRYTQAQGLTDGLGPLLLARDGRLWAAAGDLYELDGRRFRRLDVLSGVRSGIGSPVISLAEDVAGNLWMGTHTTGALRLARGGLVSFGPEDGLADRTTTAFVTGPAGEVCAQGPGFVLRCFDSGRFETVRPRLPPGATDRGWEPFPMILRARDGEWWVATNVGLARFAAVAPKALARERPRAVYGPRDGMASALVARLFEDVSSDLWIGNAGPRAMPLTRRLRASGRFETFGPMQGLPAGVTVRAFAQDRKGQLWLGFNEGGLARRSPDGRFEPVIGLDRLATGSIHALLVDAAGRLWVATGRGGLHRCDDPGAAAPRFTALVTRDGLGSNTVRCLAEDAAGRVYAGGPRGIDRVDPRSGRLRHYTTADGVAGSFFHAALRDAVGGLWFGGRQALSRLPPAPEAMSPAPRALIVGVRVAGAPQPIPPLGAARIGPIEIRAGEGHVQIEFLSLDFGSGEPRFEYRFSGSDDWSAPTPERSVTVSGLAPGRRRFQVRPAGSGGSAAAEVELRVLPPLWRRPWFQAFALVGAGAAAFGLHRYRLGRLLAVERVRRRIAADLHDDLGASLSRLSVLSEVLRRKLQERDPEAAGRLQEIATSARQAVDATSDIVWSIDPRRDDLANLAAHARELAAGLLDPSGIEWELQTPQADVALGPDQRRQLYLILKEALHNVVKHARCRRVALRLAGRAGRLRLEVEDDGRGFSPPEERASAEGKDPPRRGHGLDSIRQRAGALGGRLALERGAGGGLRLVVDVPLRPKKA